MKREQHVQNVWKQRLTYILSGLAFVIAVGVVLYSLEVTSASNVHVQEAYADGELTCSSAQLLFTDTGFTYSGLLNEYEVEYCDGTKVFVMLYWNSSQSMTVTLDDKLVSSVYTRSTGCSEIRWESYDVCPPVVPNPTATLTANPTTIYEGETSTIVWGSEHVRSVTIPGIGSNMSPGGSSVVSPAETTRYTGYYYAENNDMLTRQVTVTVIPNEDDTPTCSLTANPTTINEGETSTVTWASDNVSSVTIPDIGTNMSPDGSSVVSPAQTTTYTATCYGTNGTNLTRQVTVTVIAGEEDPWGTLSANPTVIYYGATSTVTWASDNVSSVTIPGIGTALAANGSYIVSPATTTTYTGTYYATNGTQFTRQVTITVLTNPDDEYPTCSLTASPTRVDDSGDTATITWTSADATTANITPTIGTTTLSGSMSLTINDTTHFTGVFRNSEGNEVTCSATVSVRGGGGRCINCDDDDDDGDMGGTEDDADKPTISLAKLVTKTGSYITLDQVPYTGFEASPMMTFFFWLLILGLSVGIAYFVTKVEPMKKIQLAIGAYRQYVHHDTKGSSIQNYSTATSDSVLSSSAINLLHQNDERLHVDHSATTIYTSVSEELAHEKNILLSPEALRLIEAEMTQLHESKTDFLLKLFERAKIKYPREDGWILISRDRAESLLGDERVQRMYDAKTKERHKDGFHMQNVENNQARPHRVEQRLIGTNIARTIPAPRELPTQPLRTSLDATMQREQTPTINERQVTRGEKNLEMLAVSFVGSIADNDRKKAFDMLREAHQSGIDVGTFITTTVRELDKVYKHRIEGNHAHNRELAQKTGGWSNNDFETILGTLVECIDYSYSSDTIGTKVALTKVFQHLQK